MKLIPLLLLLALPVAAQTTRITCGDNFVVPTVIQDANTDNYVANTVVTDSSGNGNNGTNINAATSVVGTNGRALQFNGTSQYVLLPNVSNLKPVTNFTVAAWFRTTASGSRTIYSTYYGGGTTENGFALHLNGSNSIGIYYAVGRSLYSTNTVNDGIWHHVVAVSDTNSYRIFVDGTLSATSASPFTPSNTTSYVRIGDLFNLSEQQFWSGSLDDIRIYNRALASNEVVSVYQGSAPTNGLVGYWPLDDATLTPNNGTNVGSATSVVGTNGRALQFNGTSQYVTVPNSASLNFFTNDFSVCVWAKPNTVGSDVNGVLSKDTYPGSGTTYKGFMINMQPTNKWAFETRNLTSGAGPDTKVLSASNAVSGVWTHLAATRSNRVLSLYINGLLSSSATESTTTDVSGVVNVTVGVLGGLSPVQYFNGSLDDIRIYNRALSSNEVVNVYQGSAPTNGLVGYWPLDDGAYQTGLVGWWPMEDNGSTTPDRSGNGNVGTLTSSPTTVPGKFGNALRFNGTSQYVTIGSSSAHNFASNQHFSVSLWVSSTAAPVANTYPMLVNKEVLSPSRQGWEIMLTSSTDNGGFNIYSGNTYRGGLLFNNFRDGKWHHLVCVRDSAGIYSYIDGLLQNQLSLAPFDVSSTSATVFMRQSVTAGNYANGSLDDVRIYNRALSAGEISSMYNSKRTFYGGN